MPHHDSLPPQQDGFVISVISTPWKVSNRLRSLLVTPFARVRFWLAGVPWQSGWKLFGLPILQRHRSSKVLIGQRLNLRSSRRSNPLSPSHPVVLSTREADALISIGDDFSMTGGSIVAATSVIIGNRVSVGANCVITDTDFHPVDPGIRAANPNRGSTEPVSIGDDVFIGMGSFVLKGVTIGPGSTIGAGSVVANDIPPRVVAAGNPARVLRTLAD